MVGILVVVVIALSSSADSEQPPPAPSVQLGIAPPSPEPSPNAMDWNEVIVASVSVSSSYNIEAESEFYENVRQDVVSTANISPESVTMPIQVEAEQGSSDRSVKFFVLTDSSTRDSTREALLGLSVPWMATGSAVSAQIHSVIGGIDTRSTCQTSIMQCPLASACVNTIDSGHFCECVVDFSSQPPACTVQVTARDSVHVDLAGDAVQHADGTMYTAGRDLVLSVDGTFDQTVGIRFANVQVNPGSTAQEAHMQFTVDEVHSQSSLPIALTITAELVADAAPIT